MTLGKTSLNDIVLFKIEYTYIYIWHSPHLYTSGCQRDLYLEFQKASSESHNIYHQLVPFTTFAQIFMGCQSSHLSFLGLVYRKQLYIYNIYKSAFINFVIQGLGAPSPQPLVSTPCGVEVFLVMIIVEVEVVVEVQVEVEVVVIVIALVLPVLRSGNINSSSSRSSCRSTSRSTGSSNDTMRLVRSTSTTQ